MINHVVIAVGCMECGVPTEMVGLYGTLEAARAARDSYLEGGDSWERYSGDGYVAIFSGENESFKEVVG